MNREKECRSVTKKAKKLLKKGDKVGVTFCPANRKRVFTFEKFDGEWMVSKSGNREYHAINIYSVNGIKTKF